MLIYRDASTALQVRLDGAAVWLSQRQIAELYGVSVPTVHEHIKALNADGEIRPEATIRPFRIVLKELS